MVDADGYASDKSVTNEALKTLINGELWKKEEKKKEKAKKWVYDYLNNPLFNFNSLRLIYLVLYFTLNLNLIF